MRAQGKITKQNVTEWKTNREELHQPLQTFPAVPARLLGLSFGIAKRNLTARRREKKEEEKGERSTSTDTAPPPPLPPAFGPPQHLLMWSGGECRCDVCVVLTRLGSELR